MSSSNIEWRSHKTIREILKRRLLLELPEHIEVVERHLPHIKPKELVARMCSWCWGDRRIWEESLVGLMPIVCENCDGSGMEYIES
jgi:superfamily II helicase